MVKRILIDAVHPEETRVVIQDDGRVDEFDYESSLGKQIKGNIYLAKVTRVEPSLQAAFVDYGGDKHGFLPFSEIHPDYYQVPVSDREELLQELKGSASSLDDVIGGNKSGADASDESEDGDGLGFDNNVVEVEDDDEASRPSRVAIHKRYNIQEVIKRNQLIQVQVIKEERGNKGASLTTYISLAGRCCVLMPINASQGGVSRRITDIEDRKRLKKVLSELRVDDGMSIIVRTAGAGKNKDDISKDYDYLKKLWFKIRDMTVASTAPAFIHSEGGVVRRFVRDYYDDSIDEVFVEGESAYLETKDFIKVIMPGRVSKVKRHKDKTPLFVKYKIEEQIAKLYEGSASLASGGYLVLNPTEALVSIDVNSGRSTSQRSVEETACKTNLEAAKEVARQLRLRDLSGLIVIDFIDMIDSRNRRAVERCLRDALRPDRAKIQVGRISPFGLLEMSRQRLRSSLMEVNTVSCPNCKGVGVVRAPESIAVLVLRSIGQAVHKGGAKEIVIYTSSEVMQYILNYKRDDIVSLERQEKVRLFLQPDETLSADEFRIEKRRNLSVGVVEPKPAVQLLGDKGTSSRDDEDGSGSGGHASGKFAGHNRSYSAKRKKRNENDRPSGKSASSRGRHRKVKDKEAEAPKKKEGSILSGLLKSIIK